MPTPAHLLSAQDTKYLLPVHRYWYLTAGQHTRLLSAGSANHVATRLNDLRSRGLLERIRPLRADAGGSRSYVYFLSSRGQAAIDQLQGISPTRYRRSERARLSVFFLDHTLAVNDCLISLDLWARLNPAVSIRELRHELELKRRPVVVQTESENRVVIHDGWIDLIMQLSDKRIRIPIALEVDRATMERKRWQERVRTWLTYLQGTYQTAFGANSLTFAIVCPGNEPRRDELLAWTEAVLREQERVSDSALFRFTSMQPASLPPAQFLSGHGWKQPFADALVSLLPTHLGVSAPPALYGTARISLAP